MTGRSSFWLTELRGKGTKLGEGEKGSKLGEPCPKVGLSQDRLPIELCFSLSLSLLNFMNVSFSEQINSMDKRILIAFHEVTLHESTFHEQIFHEMT
jgi:hypothetical protein